LSVAGVLPLKLIWASAALGIDTDRHNAMAVATHAAMFVIERVLFANFKSWNPQLLYL
jgi:hypothetical protein